MRLRVGMLRAAVIASCLAIMLFASVEAQGPHGPLYSFGDSFSDTGNILIGSTALGYAPPVPPSASPFRTYFNGRFSNGPVAVEYFWQLLSGAAPGSARGLQPILQFSGNASNRAVDFAFGGTGTPLLDQTPGGIWAPGLEGQVELFRLSLHGRKPSKNAVYVIATGANDYRDDQFNVPMSPPDVIANIVEAVDTLYSLGARTVLVYDLPDLGQLPGGDPQGSLLAQIHNALLAQGLGLLGQQHPDLRIVPIHLNELFGELAGRGFQMTVPALAALFPGPTWPFNVPTAVCLFVLPAACQDANFDVVGQLGQPFVFWDVVHPTTDAHAVLGQFLYDELVGN